MRAVGAFDAKTHFSSLLEQVERGEQIIITKHGRPVAKLVPAETVAKEDVHDAIEELKEFRKNHKLRGNWKAFRDEGRKY